MRILVTGSRNWTDDDIIGTALHQFRWGQEGPITIVHGGAGGADSIADCWARSLGYTVEVHKPDYKAYPGHLAPLKRNDAMLDSGIDLVLAFLLGTPERGGTKYTIDGAKRRGLRVVIYNWPGDPDFVPEGKMRIVTMG